MPSFVRPLALVAAIALAAGCGTSRESCPTAKADCKAAATCPATAQCPAAAKPACGTCCCAPAADKAATPAPAPAASMAKEK